MIDERTVEQSAVDQLVDAGLLDDLMGRVEAGELQLTGEGGFLPGLIKAVLERGLAAELTDHIGYEKGDPAGRGSGNSRNGTTPKTVATEVGDIALDTPRDRAGTFEPRLVPKGARRVGGLDEQIISLYAGGMTVRDIQAHLERTIGTELSHDTISKITDAVLDEVKAWQARPLEELYPIVYLDALVVKVRDGHQVRNKAAHIAVGVDLDGIKHVLGIWVQATEGAKFWAGVCAELANRGVRDVLIVCCDGLTGFPEAIEATWPKATVQTSLVHYGLARSGSGCHPHRRERASADRPSRSRRRPVPPVDDGLRTASRSCAPSAITSDGGGLSTRVSESRRRRSCPRSLASIGVPPTIKSPRSTTPVSRCSTSDTLTPSRVSTP
jgi:putative transposase